jgi:hypothetical protein
MGILSAKLRRIPGITIRNIAYVLSCFLYGFISVAYLSSP